MYTIVYSKQLRIISDFPLSTETEQNALPTSVVTHSIPEAMLSVSRKDATTGEKLQLELLHR